MIKEIFFLSEKCFCCFALNFVARKNYTTIVQYEVGTRPCVGNRLEGKFRELKPPIELGKNILQNGFSVGP